MIHPGDLRTLVIAPTLRAIGMWSQAAENLLVGTWFQESSVAGHTRLKQINGPALGGFQIEPATHTDNWENFLKFRPELRDLVLSFVPPRARNARNWVDHNQLIENLPYAAIQARIKYYRIPAALPQADDIQGLAEYWDRYYNCNPQHGRPIDFIRKYPA